MSETADQIDRHGPSNRFGVDYALEAERLGPPPCPIIDMHAHIGGGRAAELYVQAMDLFGVTQVCSMTRLEAVADVRSVLGDRIRFNAVPDWTTPDRSKAFGKDFLDRIRRFHDEGAKLMKLFAAPRMRDSELEWGTPGILALDSPRYRAAAELGQSLGMVIMTHVADPDTWFKAKYHDAARYGTKEDQYRPLERMLDDFSVPWIAAHFGGSPEDLTFIDGLLERHPNLHLDTSACKWMLRELGATPSDELRAFLMKWRGRVFFGSDIVAVDAHLKNEGKGNELAAKAGNRQQAFDLYASRYATLRRMFESTGRFESPIVDPDLHMVDPERHAPDAAPMVNCHQLPKDLLVDLYHDAAETLLKTTDLQ
jgi:predicted TIM-barrel fold metal-dependent hydrolase